MWGLLRLEVLTSSFIPANSQITERLQMKIVWSEDDAMEHETLHWAWKHRYNENWSDARKTATKVSDNGDCSEPDNYWLSAAWVRRIIKAGNENIIDVSVLFTGGWQRYCWTDTN